MSTNKPTPEGTEVDPGAEIAGAAQPDPEDTPAAAGDPQVQPGKPHPVQWEYHRMAVRDTAARIDTHQLSELGLRGWELVAVFHLHADINFIFKRFKV